MRLLLFAGVLLGLLVAWRCPGLLDIDLGSRHPRALSTAEFRNASHVATQPPFFQRGVNFTSEGRGGGYRSEGAHAMLATLRSRGVDAVALVPYGVVRGEKKELRFGGWERDESISALTATAHKLGMRVMLKPQVWIRGSYPGDFDLPDAQSRDRWLAEYRVFALHYARLAATIHADVFCVGTEFAKLSPYEDYWRSLIAEIRQEYTGPLTYAANWGEEFESLRFWDALDYMGLNNYYPMPETLDLRGQVARVEAVQRRAGRPVLFTEVGISSYAGAHRKPWAEREGDLDLQIQAAAYDALLAAFWEKPWFYGAYWWKVGSNGFGGNEDRTHTPWGKPAMDVLTTWYRKPVARPVN